MPSPIGHALGGIAAGWGSVPRRDVAGTAILVVASVAPDLDLLFSLHRGPTHSVGAALAAGALAWLVTRRPAWAAAVCLAWGSHVLLDWLGNDTRPPLGVMALWPFSTDYWKAPVEVFPAVSRQYRFPQFWVFNLKAVAVELAVLLPVAAFRVVRSGGPPNRSEPPGDAPEYGHQ